ncbi:MAG: hypothetical protein K2M40_04055 [Muribaculaceae bacterium]|nr:hypothetical protein [Muribaculaceae bacterium]
MIRLLLPFLRLPRWLLTAICSGLILYLTLVPKPLPDNDIPFWEHTDKLVHAIMFGALYVCLALDLWRGQPVALRRRLVPALISIAAGGIIELLQGAMHLGRGADPLDFLADSVGVIVAMLLV